MTFRRDSVYPLLAVSLLITAAVFGVRPLISYRALALGATPFEIGLIASSFAVLGLLGAVPVGRMTDRFGGRVVSIVGCSIVAVVLVGIVFADSLVLLAVAQAGLGLGQLMMAIGSHTTVTSRSTGRKRDHEIGLYASFGSLGVGLGPIAAGFVAGDDVAGSSGQIVFLGAAVLAVCAAIAAAVIPPDGTARHRFGGSIPAPMTFLAILRRPGMRPAILSSVVVLAAWDILVAYLPVYGEARGIAPQTIGLAIGALALSGIASRLFLSRFVARFGYIAVLATSMFVPAVVMPVFLLPLDGVGAIAAMTVAGFGLGMGQPISIVLVALVSPRHSLGFAMSLRLVGNRLGQFTIPATVGATAGQAGVGAIFVSIALLLVLGTIAIAFDRGISWDQVETESAA